MKFTATKQIDASTAEMLIYGMIGMWGDISAKSFADEFGRLEQQYININIRLNSVGGEVFDGLAIFNLIRNSKRNVCIYIDGLAASMGAVIAMAVPREKLYMSKYAKMMLHKVSGGVDGDAEQMQEHAKAMADLDNTLVAIVADRTGKTADQVKADYFQRGVDKWLSAAEALEQKLIGSLYDGPAIDAPKNMKSPEDLHRYFNQSFLNIKQESMKNIAKFIAAFAAVKINLPGDADEEKVLTAVEGLVTTNTQLSATNAQLTQQVADLQKKEKEAAAAALKSLLDTAIAQGKITAEQRPHYEKMAENSIDSVTAIINSIPARQSLSGSVIQGASENVAIPENRKEWTLRDWQAKDGKGLENLKKNHTEAFKALYKAEFGKDPVN